MFDQTPPEAWEIYCNDPKELGTGQFLTSGGKNCFKHVTYYDFISSTNNIQDIIAIKWIPFRLASEDEIVNSVCGL